MSIETVIDTVDGLREFLEPFNGDCKLTPSLIADYKHNGREGFVKINSTSSYTKVICDGDLWFFADGKEDAPYRVLNSGVYMTEAGSWEPCIEFLDVTSSETTLIPFWMLAELHRDGQMWKQGGEKMAEKLREIRAKQRKEREKEQEAHEQRASSKFRPHDCES